VKTWKLEEKEGTGKKRQNGGGKEEKKQPKYLATGKGCERKGGCLRQTGRGEKERRKLNPRSHTKRKGELQVESNAPNQSSSENKKPWKKDNERLQNWETAVKVKRLIKERFVLRGKWAQRGRGREGSETLGMHKKK